MGACWTAVHGQCTAWSHLMLLTFVTPQKATSVDVTLLHMIAVVYAPQAGSQMPVTCTS